MGIRYTQPQHPVEIDRSNPLGAKVVYASTLAGGYAYDSVAKKLGVNTAAVAKATPRGMALNFNGSSAYITLPTTNLVSGYPITVSCWFEKTTSVSQIIYSLNGSGYNAIAGYTPGNLNLSINGSSNPGNLGYPFASIPAGWNHLVVVHYSGSFTMYLNGADVTSLTTYSENWGQPAAGNHSIGQRLGGASARFFNGGIQDFIVFRGALSASEAQQVYQNPWQIFKSQSRRIWVAAAGGGDVTLPLGFVTEADSANSITSAKSRAIGQVSESDSVIGIGASKSVTLGLNVETNQAQAVALAKSAGLGITTETDTSFALLRSKLATIGQPIEADSANAVARSKTVTLGIVVETDSAPSLGAGISIAIGQVSESDTVTGIVAVKEKSTGQTVEVESVFAISLSKTLAIGLAIETDTALSLGTATIIPIGLVVEYNSATAITKVKVKAISQVIESDTVTTITSAKVASVAQVVETDTANPLLGSMVSILGLVTETEFAQSITRLKALGVLQAVEMDSVFAMNSAKTVYMSQTFEVDQVFSVFSKIDYRLVEPGYNTLSINPAFNKTFIDPNYH